ncbi:MAG: peptidase M23 [Cyanobium sp. CACIAM 14]|nr:MAG: peptidase M23 [Cyanobium sp. CACIAM 14]
MVGALGLAGQALPGEASNTALWLRGVFPVASFEGYTSSFGMRTHPLSGDVRGHYGIDIAAPLGSPIHSWWAGTVTEVIVDGGCGNGLVIRSGSYEHIYCHLGGQAGNGVYRSGNVLLQEGQRVATGQVIGHVGLTGSTTGPHLHWGMRYQGAWMDPARVLRAMAESRRRRNPIPIQRPSLGVFR